MFLLKTINIKQDKEIVSQMENAHNFSISFILIIIIIIIIIIYVHHYDFKTWIIYKYNNSFFVVVVYERMILLLYIDSNKKISPLNYNYYY